MKRINENDYHVYYDVPSCIARIISNLATDSVDSNLFCIWCPSLDC